MNEIEHNDGNYGRYKHSFKIIQSEQLFNPLTFQDKMALLICYIQYNNINNYKTYNEWMNECVIQKQNHAKYDQAHRGSRLQTYNYTPSAQDLYSWSDSLNICTKWLKILIDVEYPFVILGDFEWNVWNSYK